MSSQSNRQGRAFEFALLRVFEREISKAVPVAVEKNSSYAAAKRAWDTISESEKTSFETSALAGVLKIFEFEPLVLEGDSNDVLNLQIQVDARGQVGDVRDILIKRQGIQWEIGLSVKHNHFAVKHSRLSKTLDFGYKWFGVNCSQQYWDEIKPIFDYLDEQKNLHKKWSELPDKENAVYMPLQAAFLNEVRHSCKAKKSKIPTKIVEYLLGRFDFYKIIAIDSERITKIQAFNLRGALNKSGKNPKQKLIIPVSELPKRLVHAELKPGSNNTVLLYFDAGWQFSFRIHNATTLVETSLKFDIQIIGMPTTIITIDCKWI